ncbi:unnamed protein product [Lactuca virosa]|uniref:Heat shock protein 70 n=1 Tax=Lactuca virosa TaxID=75947 RepID=A0AAU9MPB0_9ASTR|nr:unnamed protein product [Lactuca virosa]
MFAHLHANSLMKCLVHLIRKELCKSLNPDEAVAYGAAVMAAKLNPNSDKIRFGDLVLLDVTPLSLGIQLMGEIFDVVIPRNTTIPRKKSRIYRTAFENQTSIGIRVYQGERARSTDNHLLGMFTVSGIPPVRKRHVQVKVCYEIDANGILTVTTKILATRQKNKLTITNQKGRL